jgi:hypothetical protein
MKYQKVVSTNSLLIDEKTDNNYTTSCQKKRDIKKDAI